MTITTILFDFDGTLADTNELIATSHLHVLNKYFPDRFDREKVKAFNGPSLDDVYGKLYPEKSNELIAEYRRYNEKKHDDVIKLFPDVNEMLVQLKSANFKLGIVSTKKQPLLNKGLEVLGILPHFDAVISGSDIKKTKPDPESLHLALEKLQSSPKEAIMVGDNWHDIESANRGNIKSVFVRWSEKTEAEISVYKPHKIAESMIELVEWIQTENNGGNQLS